MVTLPLSIVMNMSVCLLAYLKNQEADLAARCVWPCLGPPLTVVISYVGPSYFWICG